MHTYLKFGIDTANELNKKAIKTLASFEINRTKTTVGLEENDISDYEELKKFVDDAFSILKGDFMRFEYSFPGENKIHWEMRSCFAYEGMKKLGIQGEYECGVVYRVSCWPKELGLKHEIVPEVKKCLLNSQESVVVILLCSFNIIIL